MLLIGVPTFPPQTGHRALGIVMLPGLRRVPDRMGWGGMWYGNAPTSRVFNDGNTKLGEFGAAVEASTFMLQPWKVHGWIFAE
jgi:hypothetical protein